MKKIISIFVLTLVIILGVNAQKLSKIAPKIIVVGIGEKNVSFDESQFPDLDFYYTPTLIVNTYGLSLEERTKESIKLATVPFYKSKKMVGESYSGTPEFIINANSGRPITNTYMLFDKGGLCYTIGYDLTLSKNRQNANKKTFGDNLSAVVKKGKTIKAAKKPYRIGKTHSIIGNKLGDFPIQSIDGETLELGSLLGGEAVLVLFFQLDTDLDADAQSFSDGGAENMTNKEITYYELHRQWVYNATEILRHAEEQFFEMKFAKFKKF